MLTADETKLIQQSWTRVVPIADTAARLFYQRLFALDPELATLFNTTDMAAQRGKLIAAIDLVVTRAGALDEIRPLLAELGRRHVAYGTRPAHYNTVGAALLDTLQSGLGEAFTDDVRVAWTKAYGLIVTAMCQPNSAAA